MVNPDPEVRFSGTWYFATLCTRFRLWLVPILNQMNTVHPHPPCFCKVHFDIILTSMLSSSKQTLSFRFIKQNPVCHMPHPSHRPAFFITDNCVWLVPITTLLTVQLYTPCYYILPFFGPQILSFLLCSWAPVACVCSVWVSFFYFFLSEERDRLDLGRIITTAHQESKHHSPTNSYHIVDSIFIHYHSRSVSTQLLMPDYWAIWFNRIPETSSGLI